MISIQNYIVEIEENKAIRTSKKIEQVNLKYLILKKKYLNIRVIRRTSESNSMKGKVKRGEEK